MALFKVWESFLDIIYPMDIRCILCNETGEGITNYGICKACLGDLPFIQPPYCGKCGKTVTRQGELCPDCRDSNHPYKEGLAIFEYRDGIRDLIHRYKYGGEKYLSMPMSRWMTKGLKTRNWSFDFVVPVPLHPARLRERGFNQSQLLASRISRDAGVPLLDKGILRIKNTPHQTKLNRQERLQNLKDAFAVREKDRALGTIQGKTLLLVDDVYTTGSTVGKCTDILLENGAADVYVITLAAGTYV
ncbi:MAG: ComF family protein [Clostridiales bacterium]|nr:ComF family protein [Clostridiales bacterium]